MLSRYTSTFTATLTAQVLGLMLTAALLPFSSETIPTFEQLAFAGAAGAFGVAGVAFFYYALGRGTMGVVAPLAALIGAGLPIVIALYNGEQLSTARFAGIGVALVAVVLISLPAREASTTEGRKARIDLADLPFAVLAGLGFAGFFVLIGHGTAGGQVLWPLVAVRVVGVALVVLAMVLIMARRRDRPLRQRASDLLGIARLPAWPWGRLTLLAAFVTVGLGDLGGNVFYVMARHADLVSVAVALASLYPVITTILAIVLLHERLRPLQLAGVALAGTSVALLSGAV